MIRYSRSASNTLKYHVEIQPSSHQQFHPTICRKSLINYRSWSKREHMETPTLFLLRDLPARQPQHVHSWSHCSLVCLCCTQPECKSPLVLEDWCIHARESGHVRSGSVGTPPSLPHDECTLRSRSDCLPKLPAGCPPSIAALVTHG